jgi:hypothetical protein
MFITSLWNRLFRKTHARSRVLHPSHISELRDRLEYDRRYLRPLRQDLQLSPPLLQTHHRHPDVIWYTKSKSFHISVVVAAGLTAIHGASTGTFPAGCQPPCVISKIHKHGVPGSLFEKEDCAEDGNPSEEGMERVSARWDAIMDKMIAAFEAHIRIG